MIKNWSILEFPGVAAYIIPDKPVRDFINQLLEEREIKPNQPNKLGDEK